MIKQQTLWSWSCYFNRSSNFPVDNTNVIVKNYCIVIKSMLSFLKLGYLVNMWDPGNEISFQDLLSKYCWPTSSLSPEDRAPWLDVREVAWPPLTKGEMVSSEGGSLEDNTNNTNRGHFVSEACARYLGHLGRYYHWLTIVQRRQEVGVTAGSSYPGPRLALCHSMDSTLKVTPIDFSTDIWVC